MPDNHLGDSSFFVTSTRGNDQSDNDVRFQHIIDGRLYYLLLPPCGVLCSFSLMVHGHCRGLTYFHVTRNKDVLIFIKQTFDINPAVFIRPQLTQ